MARPKGLSNRVAQVLGGPDEYIFQACGVQLRPYQREPLGRIMESIRDHLGHTFVIVFPRQSGKDELLVNLKVYLLHLFAPLPVGIVEVNPTYQPQTVNALERFDRALADNALTRHEWRRRGRFMRVMDRASVVFLSGEAGANSVGAVASLLLIVNEAQDILPGVYAKKLEPMTASTNATRLIAGTVWTRNTLLAREMRLALQAEERDGRKRLFMVDADEVRASLPWYGAHVDAQLAKYGRGHPFVKTQYFNEELDAQGGMFTPTHRALMQPDRTIKPSDYQAIGLTAFLLDVAGQEEYSTTNDHRTNDYETSDYQTSDSSRDAVTLRIVEIDLSTLETLQAPTYRVVHTEQWTGLNHVLVFGKLKALAESWHPRHIVMDATGVGEGLWAMLEHAFPRKVIPVKFSQQQKSELGYGFLAVINSGRFRDCCPSSIADRQYAACQSEILPGPGKIMRWGVPEGTRDENGLLIHDDLPVTDSLVSVLDRLSWSIPIKPVMITPPDPLIELSRIDPTPRRRRKDSYYVDPIIELSKIKPEG